jgi:fructose-1,6-bisphosphatase/inositol monophosphatase family enzyme
VIEAGGLVTDWRGGPPNEGGAALAAANGALYAQALAILAVLVERAALIDQGGFPS